MPRWPQSVKPEGESASADIGPESASRFEEGAIHFRLQVPPLGYEQWLRMQMARPAPAPASEKPVARRGPGRAALVLVLLILLAALVVVLLFRHAISAGVFLLVDDRLTMLGGWWFVALVVGLFVLGFAVSAMPYAVDAFMEAYHARRVEFEAIGRYRLPQEVLLCDNGIVIANEDERIFTRWEAVDHRQRGEDYTWFLFTRPGGLIWLPEASIQASRDPDGVREMATLK